MQIKDLTHAHTTMMLELDINVKVFQERLGHSNIGTTLNVYRHVTKKLDDAAIDKFDLHLMKFATKTHFLVANWMARLKY